MKYGTTQGGFFQCIKQWNGKIFDACQPSHFSLVQTKDSLATPDEVAVQETPSQTVTMRRFSRTLSSLQSWARWVSSPMLKSQLVWQLFSFSWAPHLRVLKRRWRLISTWRGSSWSRHDIFIATLQSIMKWKPPIALVQELETQVELYKSKEARKLVAEVRWKTRCLESFF